MADKKAKGADKKAKGASDSDVSESPSVDTEEVAQEESCASGGASHASEHDCPHENLHG